MISMPMASWMARISSFGMPTNSRLPPFRNLQRDCIGWRSHWVAVLPDDGNFRGMRLGSVLVPKFLARGGFVSCYRPSRRSISSRIIFVTLLLRSPSHEFLPSLRDLVLLVINLGLASKANTCRRFATECLIFIRPLLTAQLGQECPSYGCTHDTKLLFGTIFCFTRAKSAPFFGRKRRWQILARHNIACKSMKFGSNTP